MKINCDTIRKLKLHGEYDKADELLEQYHIDKKIKNSKLRKKIKTEYNNKDYKIKASAGLCRWAGCMREPKENRKFCELHLRKYREAARRRKERSK